jgi:hypothetical protein
MRMQFLLGGAMIILALGPGAALAQSAVPSDALSASSLGATTCAEFSRMDATARARLVSHMDRQAPARSLSNAVPDEEIINTGTPVNPGNNTTVPGTPLSAGLLSSACQAVSGSSTLRDAYSYANSSAGSVLTTD